MDFEEIVCLKGIGTGTTRHKIIALKQGLETIIGRSPDATVQITSTMISRKHAILHQNSDNKWCIMDNKSLNGIFVNDKQLPSGLEVPLRDGDVVRLGIAPSPTQPEEYVWMYCEKQRVRKIPSKRQSNAVNITNDIISTQEKLENRDNIKLENRDKIECKSQPSGRIDTDLPSGSSDEVSEEAKIQQQERLKQIEMELEETRKRQEELEMSLKLKEDALLEKIRQNQENLEAEKKRYAEELKASYEQRISEQQRELLDKLEAEKQNILEERLMVEESLRCELQNQLEEKERTMEEKLEEEKVRLQSTAEKERADRQVLDEELAAGRKDKEEQQSDVKAEQIRLGVLTNISELMETELQCGICSELFIKATSLNCAHSFCSSCIATWMKIKRECPVCRTPITSNLRSFVLDSFIDRMVEQLSSETKERRKAMIQEREAYNAAASAAAAAAAQASKPVVVPAMAARRGSRGGRTRAARRGRGGRSTTPMDNIQSTRQISRGQGIRQRGQNNSLRGRGDVHIVATTTISNVGQQEPVNVINPIVVDSDDDDDDNDDMSMSSDSNSRSSNDSENSMDSDDSYGRGMRGAYYRGAYYGGGRCFSCGRRGHWANACPY